MESCLLCLEINKDLVDCIKVNSTKWLEENITDVLENHFWQLNTLETTSSWLCFYCWQELDSFHKFYKRIEEAHQHFGKQIKVENVKQSGGECQESNVNKFKDSGIEQEKDSSVQCYIEPEILIDEPLLQENLVDEQSTIIKEEPGNELLAVEPIQGTCKLVPNICKKDPLETIKKSKSTKCRTAKSVQRNHSQKTQSSEQFRKLKTPDNANEHSNDSQNSDSSSDSSYTPATDSQEIAQKSYYKHRTNRKENDKFITKHFKQMLCELCQVPFENFFAIQKHFSETHQQRGYVVCCKRKFFDRTRLVDHLHCHLNPDHFKCAECGKVMSDRLRLENHVMRVHRANEVVRKHCCDICGKSFTDAHSLRVHKLTHLSEEEKKFPCQECGKFYGSSYLLKQHIQAVHLKKFVKICYICGKSICSSADYKIHMNKHEGIPQPIISCDICGLRVTRERGLKRHKETQHPVGGKTEHPCPICPKISPTLKALRKHINTMHEKGYDHKCNICEKAFKRAEALREHTASHTGSTLYTCPWCPKTFNSNGNMHAHRKKVHPKEWEEAKLQKYSGNLPEELKVKIANNNVDENC
ncbi:transcription factor grauzone-like [Calliphora vicina]|uniref:transcription factor grauzone-like n=1 Tax=Calliphora vicina TaxID=7373 RepID=UPI00325C29ED